MELKIMNETENALFKRKEVKAEIDTNTTPSNQEVLKLLSEKYSVPEDAVKIKGIYGKFGLNKFSIEANVYTSKEDKEKIEIKTKKEIEAEKKALEAQKKAEEEAKAAEQEKESPTSPAEASSDERSEKAEAEKPAEETPVEEKEEEAKQDEKTEKEIEEQNKEEKAE